MSEFKVNDVVEFIQDQTPPGRGLRSNAEVVNDEFDGEWGPYRVERITGDKRVALVGHDGEWYLGRFRFAKPAQSAT